MEAVAALLGAALPGWRPPVTLPRLLLVDLLRMTYRVLDLDELAPKTAQPAAPVGPVAPVTQGPDPTQPAASARAARRAQLAQVGYNTNLLPDGAVALDLITDSWAEIPLPAAAPPAAGETVPEVADLLRGLYGYRYLVPVFRGRFAEALLARSLAGRPGIVVSNGLFPSTRFHLCCAASCTKDFQTPLGGFAATRTGVHATALRDLALAHGDGLSAAGRAVLARSLARYAHWNQCGSERAGQVQRLWAQLRDLGVPLVGPAAGHGLFVDAGALLPHLSADRHPAQALANALFLAAGVRGAVNFSTPRQVQAGVQLLRLAVPLARYSDAQLAVLVAAFRDLTRDPAGIPGLSKTYRPPGAIGDYAASYEPTPERT